MSIFKGLSAFPITPCDANGALLTDDLWDLLTRLDGADVQSIGLLGSTGTYAYLTRETRAQAIHVARAAISQKPLIVGAGALRTDDAVALAKDAQAAGADGLLLAPVSYAPLFQNEVYAHFEAVADATPLPLCIYNNPGTTHFHFTTDLLVRLGRLPTVKAVKMPLPTDMAEIAALRSALSGDVVLGYSADWGCPNCILAGAEAWFSVIAGYLPDETAKLARAAERKDQAEVDRMNAAFQPLWDLFQSWGSVRVIYAAAQIERRNSAVLPKPLLPIPQAHHDDIMSALDAARAV